MRINIDVEDRLMQQAMRSSWLRTKRAAVEAGLRRFIQTREQTCIRWLRGKVRSDEKLNTLFGARRLFSGLNDLVLNPQIPIDRGPRIIRARWKPITTSYRLLLRCQQEHT